jgi:hypothetical protein
LEKEEEEEEEKVICFFIFHGLILGTRVSHEQEQVEEFRHESLQAIQIRFKQR